MQQNYELRLLSDSRESESALGSVRGDLVIIADPTEVAASFAAAATFNRDNRNPSQNVMH
jgi:hypothetical protein